MFFACMKNYGNGRMKTTQSPFLQRAIPGSSLYECKRICDKLASSAFVH